ncbi:RING/FYVE/PHD-type zinc finger family protein [Striga asiatica]|uniref:RING/FYVE/PHD-type zinc finger family protein n=1 Tax=Striga asiatica TaxID=4170 RepID=A0A5A7REV2_STRAF|nr:RING/FYVE/PHD-type zinc finger family protein [Striga asiatica]
MAPGLVRNPKPRIIPNNSRQSLKEHLTKTKTGGLTKSNTRKTDMASDKVNKGLPITDGYTKRKCESDVRGKHGNYSASASSNSAKGEYSYARSSDSTNSAK